ncbi:MAG: DUF4139 domain-containing protein [Gemmataceae bacterium]|nr:DUF4139 domain-containing protein [Gemmataceae bacterium]MDW8263777.1 DUF4139 domain-containing protein [Gemmataceae bacterium]
MRRRIVYSVTACGGIALAAIIAFNLFLSTSHQAEAAPVQVVGAAPLPVSKVVLFSSGVGYFQREGEVEGNTRVDLTFPVTDINDLLKSLIVQDLGGGHVSAVSYDGQEPVDRTLRSFAINLTGNPSFGEILNQARGEKVEVVLQVSNTTQPGTLTGTIMGVEKQPQAAKEGPVEVAFLNLWCAEGMRSLKLAEIQRVRFLNPVMDDELRRALEVLALSHDTQKKAVSLTFMGNGKRPVKVGYVIENPIWKTSYRLQLSKDSKPFLQGWAVVENPSDEDWSDVRMDLVSGRPISFQMDLYQPLFIPRPVVEPELFASLRPPTYEGALERQRGVLTAGAGPESAGEGQGVNRSRKATAAMMPGAPLADSADAPGKQAGRAGSYHGLRKEDADRDMDLKRGVASAATATDMGNFFTYAINHSVTLPRQKSALLPIITQPVEGTKVSIYNQATHPKFPLLGLKFKNTSGLHLMQGPITVFDGGTYAGDARILDVSPNEERLISYAVDLGTEVEPVAKRDPDRLTSVKIVKGIAWTTTKVREIKTYNIKNRSDQDRLLVIEHPFRADFRLVKPDKYAERARDVYRFELAVAKNGSAQQEVIEERDVRSSVSLSNADNQAIRILMESPVTSEAVRKALGEALRLKGRLADTQRELAQVNRTLNDIVKDQERLRANLREMPSTAAAYKRYLDKFDQQEIEIEKLQEQIKKLQATEHAQRQEYEAYLMSLEVE